MPRQTNAASSTGGAKSSIARALSGPLRLVFSHCPGCMEPHTDEPTLPGAWVDPDHNRALLYYLCRHCARRLDKAGTRGRQRLADRVERNLEDMGATVGLERVGARA
jgi:hypothetical protein